jgi:hypothetical protein
MSHARPAARAELLATAHAAPPGWPGALPAQWMATPGSPHAGWAKLRTVSGPAWLLIAVANGFAALSLAHGPALRAACFPVPYLALVALSGPGTGFLLRLRDA